MKDLWVPVSAAISQQKKLDVLANNVANANTPGFKKDQLVFKEYLTVLEKGLHDIDLPNKEWAPEDFYRSYGAEHAFVKIDGSFTDHQQGQLTPTGNPLDLAVKGKGMFEVLGSNGVRYTRKGNFTISKDGVLVTDDGSPVLSKIDTALDATQGREAGAASIPRPEERTIKVPPGQVSINLAGDVFVSGAKVASISLVDFRDPHALKKEGNSLFINTQDANIIQDQKSSIYQGFVEQSNVQAISEMSDLIKAHRHLESIQKAIRTYDTISAKAVNEISKF